MSDTWRGRVWTEGEPAAGVVVSDGLSFAETDARGEYRLPRGRGPGGGTRVWVRVPAGTRCEGSWHRDDTEDPDFRLARDPSHREAFCFAYCADPHLVPGRKPQPFEAVLEELCALRPRPAFWVCGGDLEIQTGMGEPFRALAEAHPIPCRVAPGNHDLLVSRPDPWVGFTTLFGPPRYSWDHGRFHFIVLAAMVPNRTRADWRNVEGELCADELRWLEEDLERAGGRPSVVFLHIPPVSTYPERRGAAPGREPAWEVRGTEQLLRLCARHRVRLVLSGHFHENERTWIGETEFLASAAVCGHWWERGGRPAANLDGSPKGYRLVYVDGERLRTVYRPTGEGLRRQLRIVGPRAGASARAPLAIGVNVFDGDRDTNVAYRLGRGEWRRMRYTPQRARPGVFSNAHFWTAWSPRELAAGAHLLEVRATLSDGSVHTERQTVEVDAGSDRGSGGPGGGKDPDPGAQFP